MTDRIAYLEDWAAVHFMTATLDLASSGMPFDTRALPDGVELRGPDVWTPGSAPEAIATARAMVAERYPGATGDGSLVLSLGASGGVFLTALGLADEARQNHVVVESPVYEPLHRNFDAMGVPVRFLERRHDEHYRMGPRVGEAKALCQGATALVITNPHNPSGMIDPLDVIAELADAIAPTWLVIDEVYLEMVPGACSAWTLERPNVAVISSLTKTWGLGFMRFGWVVAPAELHARVASASFHTPGLYPAPVAATAVQVLPQLDAIQARASAHIDGRRAEVAAVCADHPVLRWQEPDPGMVVSTLFLDGIDDDLAFGEHLIAEHDLAVAPGSWFRAPGTLRLGTAAPAERWIGGLDRLASAATAYAAG